MSFPVCYCDWLSASDRRTEYSQYGEDGLIECIFARIGTTNRRCFEIGAADGLWFSNTASLIARGWSGVLIEGDPGKHAKLVAYCRERNSTAVCRSVGLRELDEALGVDDFDFGVIDIDGGDYWMWRHMRNHSPRVMCVEYAGAQLESDRIPPEHDCHVHNQAGGKAIRDLGNEKGYTPVVATQTNILFVRNDCMES